MDTTVPIVPNACSHDRKHKTPRRGRWHDALNALEVSTAERGVVTGPALALRDMSQVQALTTAAKRLNIEISKERQPDGSYRVWRIK